jgi:cephalosporin hydroxylase
MTVGASGRSSKRSTASTTTIDIAADTEGLPAHARLEYLRGRSSTDPELELSLDGRVMVILDSAHDRGHVLAELERFAPLVTPGCYLVVEDTNLNGHPALPDYGPGPMEAVVEFLAAHPEFEVDEGRTRHLLTFNPSGFLRRRA